MFELLLSLVFSTIITNADLPQINQLSFIDLIRHSSREQEMQVGGDVAGLASLPLAKNKLAEPKKINHDSLGIEVTAEAGILVDRASGKVLWQKDASQVRSIASLTKLMTVLVFLDNNPGWDEIVTIKDDDQRQGGVMFLATGDKVTVRDLFYLSLVRSVNCSAAALARSTGLTPEEFVQNMNSKAKELEMDNTYFVEPTGLDPKNISTAEDVVKLLDYVMQNNAIANATTLREYSVNILNKGIKRTAQSTDWLLGGFLNQEPYEILGGKTGYLVEAGYCLGLITEKQGHQVISVMLGSKSISDRFNDTKGIVDWGFRNYYW